MNPDKLFDYLDGKLSPAEREQLEEKLMTDPQLRRQFGIAREIHGSGRDAREVMVPTDDPAVLERGGRLGRRIATAAVLLVLLNVLIGLAVIAGKNKKQRTAGQREAEIRQQLAASLGAAAQNAMPPPSFAAEEVHLTAPRAEWENVASRVIAAAGLFGGSAAKGLPNDNVMTLVIDLPTNREKEFRQALNSAAAISPMPAIVPGTMAESAAPNERTIIQVRVTEPGQ
ncbi:MAG: anti-sigma factor [Chthoniobacterales bacterium]